MNHAASPEELLMHVLQELALPADELRAYLHHQDSPTGACEFRHWLTILQERDDWHPTPLQQDILAKVDAAFEGIEKPPPATSPSYYGEEEPDETLTLLDRPGWSLLRKRCRQALTVFRWDYSTPPEADFRRYRRLDLLLTNRSQRDCYDMAISWLGCVRRRPDMYAIGGIDGIGDLLFGFRSAIIIMTPRQQIHYERFDCGYSRGWKPSAVGPVPQMENRGWSKTAIIDELICIEIDNLYRILEHAPALNGGTDAHKPA